MLKFEPYSERIRISRIIDKLYNTTLINSAAPTQQKRRCIYRTVLLKIATKF
jgi:hypothetical protein